MKKILKWIVIVVLLLVIGAVALVYVSLDTIIKKVVETQGTQQLNVATTLEGVSLGLLKGTVDLNKFALASPQGFTAPQMMSLGGLAVDIGGIMQLRNKPIHINTIRIDQPKLIVEVANGNINFKALIDGLPGHPETTAAQPSAPQPTPAPAPAPTPAAQSETMKLVIDDLSINNTQVVIMAIPGLTQEIDLAVPSIDMKNIGNADGANNGAALKDVVVAIIKQMTSKAADSSNLSPELKALLAGDTNAIKAALIDDAQKRATDAISKKLGKKVPGAVGGSANDLVNQGFGMLRQASSQPSK